MHIGSLVLAALIGVGISIIVPGWTSKLRKIKPEPWTDADIRRWSIGHAVASLSGIHNDYCEKVRYTAEEIYKFVKERPDLIGSDDDKN